ncbi:hypothetical protein C5167_042616 [Papaver somniferum]|uniref:Uncharacterized protein n=1 Tax=Papaver somniferum TaxID=3469 RepID=A0A4Y7L783_PAPSO|nr:uncharacterized protein LOC113315451 [Papaver somniferum]RZC80035.1 hypothetical protein C5167_042616 [Papaver somniferum]
MFSTADPHPLHGVNAGEDIYWLVESIVPNISQPERRIIAFNLREEIFTPVTYPPIGSGRHHSVCRDRLTSLEDDTLCLSHWVEGYMSVRSKVEIWILQSQKWTLPYSIVIPEIGVPLTLPTKSQMFIWMQHYFICRRYPDGIGLGRNPEKSRALQPVRHADSLVSLKALGERKTWIKTTTKLQCKKKIKPSAASQDNQYDSLVFNFLRKFSQYDSLVFNFLRKFSQQARGWYANQDMKYAAENLHFLYQTLSKCETVVSQYLEVQPEASAARQPTVKENFQDLDSPELFSAALYSKLSLITNYLDKISKGQYPKRNLLQLADMQKEVESLLRSQGLLPFSDYSEVLKQLQFFWQEKGWLKQ